MGDNAAVALCHTCKEVHDKKLATLREENERLKLNLGINYTTLIQRAELAESRVAKLEAENAKLGKVANAAKPIARTLNDNDYFDLQLIDALAELERKVE